jgi:hypothetical protein
MRPGACRNGNSCSRTSAWLAGDARLNSTVRAAGSLMRRRFPAGHHPQASPLSRGNPVNPRTHQSLPSLCNPPSALAPTSVTHAATQAPAPLSHLSPSHPNCTQAAAPYDAATATRLRPDYSSRRGLRSSGGVQRSMARVQAIRMPARLFSGDLGVDSRPAGSLLAPFIVLTAELDSQCAHCPVLCLRFLGSLPAPAGLGARAAAPNCRLSTRSDCVPHAVVTTDTRPLICCARSSGAQQTADSTLLNDASAANVSIVLSSLPTACWLCALVWLLSCCRLAAGARPAAVGDGVISTTCLSLNVATAIRCRESLAL